MSLRSPTGGVDGLSCSVDGVHDAPCIRLTGSLDHSTVGHFREVASRHLRHATTPVRVDLSRLHDIDSAGVAALVNVSLTAKRYNIEVVLVSPTPIVRRVMEYTELDNLLDVE